MRGSVGTVYLHFVIVRLHGAVDDDRRVEEAHPIDGFFPQRQRAGEGQGGEERRVGRRAVKKKKEKKEDDEEALPRS